MECLGLFVSSFIRVSKRVRDGEAERARERDGDGDHAWLVHTRSV